MSRALGFKSCGSCRHSMPRSDPHTDCLLCLGETYISKRCKICKSFKPRTKKERDIRLWAILMESALAPTLARHSDPVPGTAVSVRGDPPVPSTSRHRSPSTGHAKRTGKTPSSQRHQGKSGIETRPMSGSPRSSPGPRPLTHAEQSSPAPSEQASLDVRVPSMPEALQVAKDIMSMPVPGAPPMSAPCSRGKLPLGSPQSPPAQSRSQLGERSQHCSPPSDCSRLSPCGSPSTPVRLSGWVPSNQDFWPTCLRGASTDGTKADISKEVPHLVTVPSWTPAPSLCQGTIAPGVDCWRLAVAGPPVETVHGAATDVSAVPPPQGRGPVVEVDPGIVTTSSPEEAAHRTPAWAPLTATCLQTRLASPISRPRRCLSKWYQWAPWPPA
ncbi:uncharacterized protein LOC135976504 [Chrysemys picta bellii]|uniref:uncharacterized protein LOC135976504 n=1 Tax=Chrysemys picta bellii TaxID=8478 RepID=UPI0032B2F67D